MTTKHTDPEERAALDALDAKAARDWYQHGLLHYGFGADADSFAASDECVFRLYYSMGFAGLPFTEIEEVSAPTVTFRCKGCGGANVQHAMWVALNTNEPQDGFGSWCNGANNWCNDCDDHTEIEEVSAPTHALECDLDEDCTGCP